MPVGIFTPKATKCQRIIHKLHRIYKKNINIMVRTILFADIERNNNVTNKRCSGVKTVSLVRLPFLSVLVVGIYLGPEKASSVIQLCIVVNRI